MASVLDIIRHYQQAIEKHPDDEQRVLRSIGKLHQLSVTVDHLQETGVGRTVNALRKEPGDVGHAARSLVNKWKHMVTMETMRQEAEANNHESSNANGNGHQDSDPGGNQSDHGDRQSDHRDKQNDHRDRQSDHRDRQSDHRDRQSDRHDRKSDHRDRYSDQERSHNSSRHMNGDHNSSKRKQQSSDDDDEPNMKRSKHQGTSESDDNEQKPDVKVKTEPQESNSDESDSDDSQSDSSQEIQIKKEIKQEPQEQERSGRHNSKESSKQSHSDDIRSSYESKKHRTSEHSSRHDQPSTSKDEHSSSKHDQSRSKHKESHKYNEKETSDKHKSKDKNEASPEKRHKSHHKEQEEEKGSKRHSSDRDRSSSSHKQSSSSEKHKASHKHDNYDHKHKSDKNKSSSSSKSHKTVRSDDEHKSSSEKHRSKESSSKTHHSSSDKEKNKEKRNSSKDKSSHNDRKHTSSSDSKSKSSDSKSKSSKAGDSSSGSETKNKSSSSNKTSKSSNKTKETVPKNKKSQSEDSDDGIGCDSGASFAEALGMLSPSKPKKKSSNIKDIASPGNSSSSEFGVASLLAPSTKLAPLPTLEISALPEISPNYKPRPPPKLLPHFTDEEALSASISSKNQRTKVYSGNKMYGKLPTLYEMCVNVLQEHIDALEYTGGVPYDILKPVVDKATPQQLFVLEHYNPYLMEDTDHLWQAFCAKHFRKQQREEMETWREMYARCQEEQETRLKSLTQTIRIAQEAKKAPVKQTKMAYVDTVVKPPRNIARKQAIHGTARLPAASPAARVSSLSGPLVARPGVGRPAPVPHAALTALQRPKKAPLMAKALQFMRGRKR